MAGRIRPAPARAAVPAWIRRVLLRGLASDPEARWPSMTDARRGAASPRRPAQRERDPAIGSRGTHVGLRGDGRAGGRGAGRVGACLAGRPVPPKPRGSW